MCMSAWICVCGPCLGGNPDYSNKKEISKEQIHE